MAGTFKCSSLSAQSRDDRNRNQRTDDSRRAAQQSHEQGRQNTDNNTKDTAYSGRHRSKGPRSINAIFADGAKSINALFTDGTKSINAIATDLFKPKERAKKRSETVHPEPDENRVPESLNTEQLVAGDKEKKEARTDALRVLIREATVEKISKNKARLFGDGGTGGLAGELNGRNAELNRAVNRFQDNKRALDRWREFSPQQLRNIDAEIEHDTNTIEKISLDKTVANKKREVLHLQADNQSHARDAAVTRLAVSGVPTKYLPQVPTVPKTAVPDEELLDDERYPIPSNPDRIEDLPEIFHRLRSGPQNKTDMPDNGPDPGKAIDYLKQSGYYTSVAEQRRDISQLIRSGKDKDAYLRRRRAKVQKLQGKPDLFNQMPRYQEKLKRARQDVMNHKEAIFERSNMAKRSSNEATKIMLAALDDFPLEYIPLIDSVPQMSYRDYVYARNTDKRPSYQGSRDSWYWNMKRGRAPIEEYSL